jgi:hypothetical protein
MAELVDATDLKIKESLLLYSFELSALKASNLRAECSQNQGKKKRDLLILSQVIQID